MMQVGDNLSHLLHLVKDLTDRAQDLLISGEHLVNSFTCDDLDQLLFKWLPGSLCEEDPPLFALPVEEPQAISWPAPAPQGYSTQCTPATSRINSYRMEHPPC
ncbi:hypothetical protein DSO57_1008505 [Entomophthora muscae]|uniref:Uncharacterized protein n=1 Tax=Entomophthora muscae TaxID=34485 RepID=A0ACC2TI75_9FUNG|nr:hypothetical protein DSO57_1008505 [Entomophthora muscae]